MQEIKKTFITGFSILIILLLAPYYLAWIGYDDGTASSQNTDLYKVETNPKVSPQSKEEPPPNTEKTNEVFRGGSAYEKITIETPLYSADFSNFGGGSFETYELKQFSGSWEDDSYIDTIRVSLLANNSNVCAPCIGPEDAPLKINFNCSSSLGWKNNQEVVLDADDELSIVCFHVDTEGNRYTKTTIFSANSYSINHDIVTSNPNEKMVFYWDAGLLNTEKNIFDENTYSGISISNNKEIETVSFSPGSINDKLEKSSFNGNIDWVAIRNKYFVLAMIPDASIGIATGSLLGGGTLELNKNNFYPVYTASISGGNLMNVKTYLGPLDIDQINLLDTTLDRIMNFGWYIIQPFSRGILWLLKFLHSFGLNYGIILILFAFLVRVVTGPLTKKSFQSTQKMQAVQPKLKKIQEKYKSDPQKLNAEMVKLYRDNGVNPLGGCLPMVLQMPLLFSLFLVFRSTIEFRGAYFFGWIKDLSLPDTIFSLPFHIPIYGDQVAFLPILLGISMFLTQKMSMSGMQGTAPGQQKYMMYFMSGFFFLIFNSFPSGLNLYYLIYNILNYLQQKSLKKA